MAGTTTINALRYPTNTDGPVAVHTAFLNLATDVDNRVVPRFATTTARDSAIPSPTNGQVCYITDTAVGNSHRAINIWNGTAWQPYYRSPLFVYKTASESVTSNTTVQADDHLLLTMEANTKYQMNMWLNITGLDAADLKYNFTYPAGCSVAQGQAVYSLTSTGAAPVYLGLGHNLDATSPTADQFAGTITSNTVSVMVQGMVTVGSTAGNLQLMWAQSTSSGTAVVLDTGSYLMLTRVA